MIEFIHELTTGDGHLVPTLYDPDKLERCIYYKESKVNDFLKLYIAPRVDRLINRDGITSDFIYEISIDVPLYLAKVATIDNMIVKNIDGSVNKSIILIQEDAEYLKSMGYVISVNIPNLYIDKIRVGVGARHDIHDIISMRIMDGTSTKNLHYAHDHTSGHKEKSWSEILNKIKTKLKRVMIGDDE